MTDLGNTKAAIVVHPFDDPNPTIHWSALPSRAKFHRAYWERRNGNVLMSLWTTPLDDPASICGVDLKHSFEAFKAFV